MTQSAPKNESPVPCAKGSDLPTTPDELLARLDALDIAYTLHHHPAVYTVAESEAVDADIPGTHCRNFFLRDKKKRNFLLSLQNATEVDMKKLAPLIGGNNLSFGSAERLWDYLGVRPGSVCPYAITNDKNNDVTMVLDASMMDHDILNFHPLINTMTISVKPADIVRFIESTGHTPHIIDLSPAAPDKD
jgi:Ala-tRNA(Pro) deacylase